MKDMQSKQSDIEDYHREVGENLRRFEERKSWYEEKHGL